MNNSEIRNQLRNKRQAISPQQQTDNAKQALYFLKQFLEKHIVESCDIAMFLSQDGELETKPSIDYLWSNQHRVYLPVLECNDGLHMAFANYEPESEMRKNQFGILEPDISFEDHLTGRELDIVVMPLVGFDKQGNRLGMGGGYYDRSFNYKLTSKDEAPILVGWAHSFQQVENLHQEAWDVPLDAMITEQGIIEWKSKR
jgi:5-formyltetrahydrofolate cyclo-ligase